MRQKATVISTDGDYATVKADRSSMCDGCHKSGCSDNCALYKIFGAKTEFEAVALNRAGARVGDMVYVEASDKSVNMSALIVFILPIVIAAAVYFALYFVKSESLRILFAVLSFVLYFAVLSLVERLGKNKRARLCITEIIDASND